MTDEEGKDVNDNLKQIALQCRDASHDGSMTFPQIVALLGQHGFEGYLIDFRRKLVTYYTAQGESIELPTQNLRTTISAAFDAVTVQRAIKEAQSNAPGSSYLGFCEKVTAAGCAGYLVSFSGRRVVYFGRTAETHVELMPN
jgi:uncharacterized protein YbcV (DUF1398 family)